MSEPDDESAALQATLPADVPDDLPGRPGSGAVPQRAPDSIGRFEVLGEIGRGGMGVVYRARDPELEREVALKLLHRDVIVDDDGRARLRREAQALARSAHPNVVHVYEIGAHEGQVFVVMELVDGDTLRRWLAQSRRAWTEIVDMFLGAASGLRAAHRAGLVHRDFKPDNVLVGADGRPRVVDFGLARPGAIAPADAGDAIETPMNSTLESITLAGTLAGTPAYMAPEQFRSEPTDARTDVFAFCVALFEALFERHPFAADTFAATRRAVLDGRMAAPKTVPAGMPARVHALVERGLAVRPADRYADLAELADALASIRLPRRAGRRAAAWAVMGAAAAFVGVAGLASIARDRDPSPAHDDAPDTAATAAITAILAASELPEPLPIPLADDPGGLTIHRLANGLTVYVSPRRDQPRIQARLVLRVGSTADPPDTHGAANLLARLTRNGGARLGAGDAEAERPVLAALHEGLRSESPDRARLAELEAEAARYAVADEYDELLAELGVSGRTSVGREQTTVSADLPSARLEAWLRLEAERLRAPVFRGFLREVVASAVNPSIREDELAASIEPYMRVLYRGQTLEHAPRGSAAELARLPLAAIEQLHADWYVPNNAALVLVGDVDPASATALVEAAFADWVPRALPPRPLQIAAAPPPRRASANVDHPVAFAWRRPAARDPSRQDWDALVHAFTDEVEAGCREQGSSVDIVRWDHGVALATTAAEDRIAAVVEGVLGRIAADGLTRRARAAALESRRLARALVFEDDAALADFAAQSYATGMPWPQAIAIASLTDDAAIRDLARALGDYTIITQAPDEAPPAPVELPALGPAPAPAATPRRSAFATELLALPHSLQEPQFLIEGRHYRIRTGPGGTAIATTCEGGVERIGVVLDARDVLASGGRCSSLTVGALAHFQALGDATGGGASGPHEARVRLACVDDSARFSVVALPTVDLGEWTEDPSDWLVRTDVRGHLAEVIERWGEIVEFHGRSARTQLLPRDLLELALYADSPSLVAQVGFDTRPSERDVLEAWRRAAGSDLVFLYCGPRSDEFLAAAPIDAKRSATHVRELARRPRRLDRPQVLALHAPDVPTRAFVTLRLPPDGPLPDEATVEVLEQYLALRLELELFGRLRGQGVELDANLRLHLPSAADPLVTLDAELQVEPARMAEAIALLTAALRRADVDAALVERAVARVDENLRSHRIAPRDVPETVLDWRHRGLSGDPRVAVWGGLAAVTSARLGELARRLAELPPVVAVTGDLEAIDLAALDAIAPVQRVTRAQVVER